MEEEAEIDIGTAGFPPRTTAKRRLELKKKMAESFVIQ